MPRDAEEVIASLRPRWATLGEAARADFAARWVDRCVRLECGLATGAITDEASMLRVEVELSRLLKAPLDETRLATVYFLLGHFELLKGVFELDEVAHLVIGTSRRVQGDDRLVRLVEQDLAAISRGAR